MSDFTRREFLATSVAASAAAVLPGGTSAADNSRCSTGFTALDDLVGGLRSGWLVVLAGWPSVGKTALAMAVAQQAAVEDRLATLFVTLEGSQLEIAERLLCSRANVPCSTLRRGRLSAHDRERITRTATQVSRSPLFVCDKQASVPTIRTWACQFERQHLSDRLRLIVVDSLQLIDPCDPQQFWAEQILHTTCDLKALAVELEVPIVCTVQMHPANKSMQDHRPRLSDIRAIGPIEPYADLIIFAHRQTEDCHSAAGGISREAELIVAKNRSGPVSSVDVRWNWACAQFDVL